MAQTVKNLLAMQATRLQALGGEDPLKEGFLPVESHGQRSLAGYNPWGRKVKGHDLLEGQTTTWIQV